MRTRGAAAAALQGASKPPVCNNDKHREGSTTEMQENNDVNIEEQLQSLILPVSPVARPAHFGALD
jgi:hypothetical protein